MKRVGFRAVFVLAMSWLSATIAFSAIDYVYETGEPQKSGWPLTEAERMYVLKPEYQRRPGSEKMQYLPKFWPAVPSAGYWSGTAWLDTHAKLVEYIAKNKGNIDILLAGDSITQQWGSPLDNKPLGPAWQKHFGKLKTANIGIGGDKTQNLLWRLDHGGVDGISPRLIVLMIGNNNMFFTPETGVDAAASGVAACVKNLRQKFPNADVILIKILPAGEPGAVFFEDIKKTNAAVEKLNLTDDRKVHLLDLTADFIGPDGKIRQELYTQDKVHLSPEGYERYAGRLKPLIEKIMK